MALAGLNRRFLLYFSYNSSATSIGLIVFFFNKNYTKRLHIIFFRFKLRKIYKRKIINHEEITF